MKNLSVPERTCVGCNTVAPKKELLRIVHNEEGIFIDPTGKKNGRGAYVCRNRECFELLKKKKGLNRAFKINVPEEIYDALLESFMEV